MNTPPSRLETQGRRRRCLPKMAPLRCRILRRSGDRSSRAANVSVILTVGVHVWASEVSGCVDAEREGSFVVGGAGACDIELGNRAASDAHESAMDAVRIGVQSLDLSYRVDAEAD